MGTHQEVSLVGSCLVLWRRKWFIFALVILVTLSSLVYNWKAPGKYRATSSVLVVFDQQSLFSLPISTSSNEILNIYKGQLVAILNSSTLADKVIDKFSPEEIRALLRLRPEARPKDVIKTLRNSVRIPDNYGSLIKIEATLPDQRSATQLANTYMDTLNSYLADQSLKYSVHIMDRANDAIKISKKRQSVFLSFLISFFLAVFLAFLVEYLSDEIDQYQKSRKI